MRTASLLFAAAAAVAPPAEISEEFIAWAQEHGKSYDTLAAWRTRYQNYLKNAELIKQVQADEEGTAVYGHTHFSDYNEDELKMMAMQRMGAHATYLQEVDVTPLEDAPASFDWREKGAVAPVRNQGGCGSCYAISAVETVESAHFIATGGDKSKGPEKLSLEQVLECDAHDYACYGGWMRNVFTYLAEAGGLATDSDYQERWNGHTICLANQTFNATCGDGMCDDPPLTSYCEETCRKTVKKAVRVDGPIALPQDETKMRDYLVQNGPLSIGIDASGPYGALFGGWLQWYKSGIASPKKCSSTTIDHGLQLVGYGTEDGKDYWLIKNSWGEKWGKDKVAGPGFFRLERGTNKCAVATYASYVKLGSDAEVVV